MTMNHTADPADVDAVVAAVGRVEPALFSLYSGTWENTISMALLDAVYSIQARYHAGKGKGVWNRLDDFRTQHPEVLDDLDRLVTLSEGDIRHLMRNGKTSKVYKSVAALEAAENLRALGIRSARDLRGQVPDVEAPGFAEVKKAYTSVHGLGKVTFEYFLMLLGIPGVKADVMIRRFVAQALGESESAASETNARQLVIAAHDQLRSTAHYPENLSAFDHALWQHQRTR